MNRNTILLLFLILVISDCSFMKRSRDSVDHRSYKDGKSELNLLAVSIYIRHGARAPHVEFAQHKSLYFGSKRTQLTINGVRQHILLGRWLRRRYIHGDVGKLIEKYEFKAQRVKVYASPTQRAIFSAAALIIGLFPDSIPRIVYLKSPEIKTGDVPPIKNYKYDSVTEHEIKINVVDKKNDNLFKVQNCFQKGSHIDLKKKVKKIKLFTLPKEAIKQAIKEILKKYGSFYSEKTKSEMKYTQKKLYKLADVLRQRKYHTDDDLNLSHDTIETMKKNRINHLYHYSILETPEKKLFVSHFFDILKNYFLGKIGKKNKLQKEISNDVRFALFSGHDNTITHLLVNLLDKNYLLHLIYNFPKNEEYYSFLEAPLASSIVFELLQHKKTHKNYVRIVYNGEELTENFIVPIRYYKKYQALDFDDFMKLIDARLDQSYHSLSKCKHKH